MKRTAILLLAGVAFAGPAYGQNGWFNLGLGYGQLRCGDVSDDGPPAYGPCGRDYIRYESATADGVSVMIDGGWQANRFVGLGAEFSALVVSGRGNTRFSYRKLSIVNLVPVVRLSPVPAVPIYVMAGAGLGGYFVNDEWSWAAGPVDSKASLTTVLGVQGEIPVHRGETHQVHLSPYVRFGWSRLGQAGVVSTQQFGLSIGWRWRR